MALTAAASSLDMRPHGREVVERDREPRRPVPGEEARGCGVEGRIAVLRRRQPLASDGIWRVSLLGEAFGRLVRPAERDGWRLLQIDDLTDLQLEVYDAAMQCAPQDAATARTEAPDRR